MRKITLYADGTARVEINDRENMRSTATTNRVMRLGGGSRTAVLGALGYEPDSPGFEAARQRFFERQRYAATADVGQMIGGLAVENVKSIDASEEA